MTDEITYCECGEGTWDGQNFCVQCGRDLRKKVVQTTIENQWF
jgi:hypothetical protein